MFDIARHAFMALCVFSTSCSIVVDNEDGAEGFSGFYDTGEGVIPDSPPPPVVACQDNFGRDVTLFYDECADASYPHYWVELCVAGVEPEWPAGDGHAVCCTSDTPNGGQCHIEDPYLGSPGYCSPPTVEICRF